MIDAPVAKDNIIETVINLESYLENQLQHFKKLPAHLGFTISDEDTETIQDGWLSYIYLIISFVFQYVYSYRDFVCLPMK